MHFSVVFVLGYAYVKSSSLKFVFFPCENTEIFQSIFGIAHVVLLILININMHISISTYRADD